MRQAEREPFCGEEAGESQRKVHAPRPVASGQKHEIRKRESKEQEQRGPDNKTSKQLVSIFYFHSLPTVARLAPLSATLLLLLLVCYYFFSI